MKDKIEAPAHAEGLSVNVWAERLFEANVLPEEKTMAEQHKEARRLLPLLFQATRASGLMTYADAVKSLGWNLR